MELNTLLQYKPYSTARTEKRALYAGLLTALTQFHRQVFIRLITCIKTRYLS